MVRRYAAFIALSALGALAALMDGGAAVAHPLAYEEYEVRFTNPLCKRYAYRPDQQVVSIAGESLAAKPKDVYCTRSDEAASAARPEAPQAKLLSWIADPATTEIFFAYLSFSNKTVAAALCKAVEERDVKVTFVLDKTTDLATANTLLACRPASGDASRKPTLHLRGQTGGLGYAHNKLFAVNPGAETMRLAFSSGNMTSGIVLHHENWHFITLKRDTYFAQAHLCLIEGVLEHGGSAASYRNHVKSCRARISFPEESDVKTFFVPGEGPRATKFLTDGVKRSSRLRLAAHRFSYDKLLTALNGAMRSANPPDLQMVFDDDLWWVGHGEQTGDNQRHEYTAAAGLVERGAEARWMETNHPLHLLHHNKFVLFDAAPADGMAPAVFTGAGNFTGTAFSSNYENFYYIEIPEVVEAYRVQWQRLWGDLATPIGRLPRTNMLP